MKKYIKPFSLAVVINTLVIVALFHTHFSQKIHGQKKAPTIIKVNLSDFEHRSTTQHDDYIKQDIVWLKKHYGREVLIEKHFLAGDNLAGYVVALKSDPDAQSLIYSVNHGQYYLVGTVIDNVGKNVTLENTHHYITSNLNKHIFNQVQKLQGIYQGKKNTPMVTIIIDPNSNLFPEQWSNMEYDVEKGVFSVKWVLVNYLKPMGPNVASNILQAKDKIAALSYNAEHYNVSTQSGGYIKNSPVPKNIQAELMANWSFVQKYGLYKLPITILSNHNHYYVLQGVVIDETLEGIINGDA